MRETPEEGLGLFIPTMVRERPREAQEEESMTASRNRPLRGIAAILVCGVTVVGVAAGCRGLGTDGVEGAATLWAIEPVTVVDASSGARPAQRVVVRGDEIVWVGPVGSEAPTFATDRVIDGGGRFLVPGLWDAHVHFVYDEALTEAMPDLFLDHGITSVRDTGGDLDRLVGLRAEWRAAGRKTPRIFVAGPLLDGRRVVYDGEAPAQPPLGTSTPDVEAAREAVARIAERGGDLIKIYELVSPEVFAALVTAAREAGLPIASHVPLALAADEAGPQVDSMEHLRNIDLACAADWEVLLEARRARIAAAGPGRGHPLRKAMHEDQRYAAIANSDPARCDEVLASLRGTMQVPTLRLNAFNATRPFEETAWQAAAEALPEDVRARWAETVDALSDPDREWDLRFANWSLGLVSRMRDAGVPVAAGTDTPIRLAIPGESLHRELELLVESGFSPREALGAATLEPARFFGLDEEMGRIEAGQRADLLLLDADPLADVRHLRRIRGVVSRGEWVRGPEAR